MVLLIQIVRGIHNGIRHAYVAVVNRAVQGNVSVGHVPIIPNNQKAC